MILVTTEEGVTVVDPERVSRGRLAPPVAVEHVRVDGRDLDLSGPGDLTFRGEQVEVAFTAPDLSTPETIQFRYKLDNVDKEWREGGSVRRLDYVNLAPGGYKLWITDRSNGNWNPTPASLAFRIPYYFYETWTFRLLTLLTVVFAGYGVYWERLRRTRFKLQVMYQERLRVTRELHDTILQGFAGVVLQLEAGLRQMDTRPEASKRRLEAAARQADAALEEARHAISLLRIPALESATFPDALGDAVRLLAEGRPVSTKLQIDGPIQAMKYEQQANLYAIAREAVTNALNHGNPRAISLHLAYDGRYFKLKVCDDGSGFSPQQDTQQGHLGLTAMRERAKRINADLHIVSSPGFGCLIEVSNEPAKKKAS